MREEVILDYINDRGIPPSPQSFENIIIEIVRQPIGGTG